VNIPMGTSVTPLTVGCTQLSPRKIASSQMPPNPTDEQRVKLHKTMIAYAGTYTVEADKVIHRVDISWNEARTGTDQIRFFKLDGNILTITTPPFKSAQDSREGRSALVWEKVKAPTR
jgi:Lipocalin-like domain